MLTALALVLAALLAAPPTNEGQPVPPEATARAKAPVQAAVCPHCGQPIPLACPVCPDDCRCPFPGACKRPGCTCRPVSGLIPASQDRWAPYLANDAYEVFGHEVDEPGPDGKPVLVFRYTQSRLKPKATSAAVRSVVCVHCGKVFTATGPSPVCTFCHRINP